MSTDLIYLVCLVVLMFILNRLGFHAWVWWTGRHKRRMEDSSAQKYWSAHE